MFKFVVSPKFQYTGPYYTIEWVYIRVGDKQILRYSFLKEGGGVNLINISGWSPAVGHREDDNAPYLKCYWVCSTFKFLHDMCSHRQ